MTLPGHDPDDGSPDDEGVQPDARPPSRSQKHRDVVAVNQLGLDLIALIPSDLALLDLPEALRHEIDVCQGLKMRAQGRQKRLIGQILRGEDHEAIRNGLDSLRMTRVTGTARDRTAQKWRVRLIDEGDPALQAFVDEHAAADRSQLRSLMRSASKDPEVPKVKRARRDLLRAIRGLLD